MLNKFINTLVSWDIKNPKFRSVFFSKQSVFFELLKSNKKNNLRIYVIFMFMFISALFGKEQHNGRGIWLNYAGKIMLGTKAYRQEGIGLSVGIGGNKKWIPAVGVGFSLVDIVGINPWGSESRLLGGFFPFYIKSMIPLGDMKYLKKNSLYYYSDILYSFFTICGKGKSWEWVDVKWHIIGGGYEHIIFWAPQMIMGFEAGYIYEKDIDFENFNKHLYFGIIFGFEFNFFG